MAAKKVQDKKTKTKKSQYWHGKFRDGYMWWYFLSFIASLIFGLLLGFFYEGYWLVWVICLSVSGASFLASIITTNEVLRQTEISHSKTTVYKNLKKIK